MSYVTSQRDRDKAIVVNVLRNFGPISRVEIHDLTHLRHSTISQLTKELLEEGVIEEAGASDNPLGRKQTLLRLNAEQGYVLAVEVDAEGVAAAVIDVTSTVRSFHKEPTDLGGGVEGILRQMLACSERAVAASGIDRTRLTGIGIADMGLVNRKLGVAVMTSQLEFWRNVPLGQVFSETFQLPVIVENATRCRAISERVLGSGESAGDMVYVEYGAGIGSAIFAGGRLLEGSRSIAGELGHTHLMEGGPACKCGSLGCLEALAGAAALADRFRKVYVDGSSSKAVTLAGGDAAAVTGWNIMAAAQQGDKISGVIVEGLARHLGLALANLVNLVNPALIVLDRRLEVCGQEFLDQVQRVIRLQALSYATEELEIRYGKLRDDAGALGAALLVLDERFAIPDLKPPRFLVEPEAVEIRSAAGSRASR